MDSRDLTRDRGRICRPLALPDRPVRVLGFVAGLVALVFAMLATDPDPVRETPEEPAPPSIATEAPTIEAPRWAPGEALTREALEWILSQAGAEPGDVGDLVSIAWCESRWRPWVRNASGAAGLFQLMPLWFRYAGADLEAWADPMVNARVAVLVVAYGRDRGQRPFAPWECRP